MTSITDLSGIEKAGLLLINLGTIGASEVLKHLTPDEVQRLATQIAESKEFDPEAQTSVVREFNHARRIGGGTGGMIYVKDLLEQSLGPIKAREIIDDINAGSSGRPFDWVKSSNVGQLVSAIQKDRPQVIALILAHLPPNLAADVMSQLSPESQGAVAYKLTGMRPLAPETVRVVDELLKDKLSRDRRGALRAVGGIQSLVTILNIADRTTESKILEYLEGAEASVAESVRQLMFVFDDIVTLPDRAMQIVIRELEPEDLKLSMKGASDALKDIFFRNMSERAVEVLKDDLEMMGAVKLRDVEAARRKVVAVVHKLDEMGEISIRPEEEEVVI